MLIEHSTFSDASTPYWTVVPVWPTSHDPFQSYSLRSGGHLYHFFWPLCKYLPCVSSLQNSLLSTSTKEREIGCPCLHSHSWQKPGQHLNQVLHDSKSNTLLTFCYSSVVSDSPWPHGPQPGLLSSTISSSLSKFIFSVSMTLFIHLILCHSLFPSALNLSQHEDLFQWVLSFQYVAKVFKLLYYLTFQSS